MSAKSIFIKYKFAYLIKIQFLGFRFHGWQKQPGLKTLHDMVDKTLSFVFEHFDYKTIGAGRTDAKVSSQKYILQLFTNEEIIAIDFIKSFNKNVPGDLKALSIKPCALKYNLIGAPKLKTYHYYFSFGEKQHPYAAPFMVGYTENLDIETMKKAALLFQGKHFFNKYCCKPSAQTKFYREINTCEIIENKNLQANFFPKKTYVLAIKGSGFLRYQIRYTMAVLLEVGRGNMTLTDIKNSLQENNDKKPWSFIAASSGLHLFDIELLD